MDIKRKIKLLFPELYIWKSSSINRRHSKMNDQERRHEISRLYKHYLGRDLDWNNLTSYTEKMQWKKLILQEIFLLTQLKVLYNFSRKTFGY